MKTLVFEIQSIVPLLMHDDKTANPLNEYTKKLKALTGKRKKTDEDHGAIAEVEWNASLYYENGKYIIPTKVLEATLLASAKQFKKGTLLKQCVIVSDDLELRFKDSNIKPAKLYQKLEYVDMRTVKIGQAKTTRCRPKFDNWSGEFTVILDDEKLNAEEIEQIVSNAGKYVGLCDYRPRYGRFEVISFKCL
jgi:predicted ribonuclease YlaK